MKVNHWGRARKFIKAQEESGKSGREVQALYEALAAWKKSVVEAEWKGPAEIREKTFGNVSYYKNALIFNIGGNKYRLIAICRYELGTLYIDKIMTHEEYDLNHWKKRYDKKK